GVLDHREVHRLEDTAYTGHLERPLDPEARDPEHGTVLPADLGEAVGLGELLRSAGGDVVQAHAAGLATGSDAHVRLALTGAGRGPDGEDGLLDGERLPGVGRLQAHAGEGRELGAGGGVGGGHRGYRLSSRQSVRVGCTGQYGRAPHSGSERPERLEVLVELLGAEAQVQSARSTETDGRLGTELQLESVRAGLELPGRLGTGTGGDARLAADAQAEELIAGLGLGLGSGERLGTGLGGDTGRADVQSAVHPGPGTGEHLTAGGVGHRPVPRGHFGLGVAAGLCRDAGLRTDTVRPDLRLGGRLRLRGETGATFGGQPERLAADLARGSGSGHSARLGLSAGAARAMPAGGARVGLRFDRALTTGVQAQQVDKRGPETVFDLAGHLVGDAVGGGVEGRLPGVVVLVEEACLLL